jgi:hypothetical protein
VSLHFVVLNPGVIVKLVIEKRWKVSKRCAARCVVAPGCLQYKAKMAMPRPAAVVMLNAGRRVQIAPGLQVELYLQQGRDRKNVDFSVDDEILSRV